MSKLALGIAVFALAVFGLGTTAASAQDSTPQTTAPPAATTAKPSTAAKKPVAKKPATAATTTAAKSATTKSATAAKPTTVHHTATKATPRKTVARKRTAMTKPNTAAPTPVKGPGVTSPSGLQYWDIKVGAGATAVAGQEAEVHYTGWLTDGHKFDSSVDRGQPFPFTIGQGAVIKGWDEGVAGMKVGGKRQLRIPPQLAYGVGGREPVIPPNSTLIFDVELLGLK